MNRNLERAVEIIKTTDFYKNFIAKLYFAEETPDTIYFEPKADYKRCDETALFNELNKNDVEYFVSDKEAACIDTDEGTKYFNLKELV